jgi:plasmid stabilization system protein ParE
MAFEMEIVWTSQARKDYYKILDYLQENWGLNEVKNFIDKTEEVLNVIKKFKFPTSVSLENKG